MDGVHVQQAAKVLVGQDRSRRGLRAEFYLERRPTLVRTVKQRGLSSVHVELVEAGACWVVMAGRRASTPPLEAWTGPLKMQRDRGKAAAL